MFGMTEALLLSGLRMQQQQAHELRQRLERERVLATVSLQWAAQCSPASLSPAARVCAYCGRPPKATARRGDGCEGCGAPLGRGDE